MSIIAGCTTNMVDRIVNYTCRDVDDEKVYVSGSVSACSDGYSDAVKNAAGSKLNTDVSNLSCSFDESALQKTKEVFQKDDVSVTKMSRDCGPSYNLRNIIHHNHFKCKYTGEVVMPNGQIISDRQREYKGMLPSCGIGKESSKVLLQDIKDYVYDAVDGKSVGLDKTLFDCTIMGVPPH